MTATMLTTFLGWSLVINFGLYLFTVVFLLVGRDFAAKMHAKMFGINREQLALQYFHYIALYKLAIILFNLVPYIAMKIVSA